VLIEAHIKQKRDFNRFKNQFGPVTNAFKGMYKAKDDLWATVVSETAKDPELQALIKSKDLSEGRKRDLTFQLDMAIYELNHQDSPLNQILDGDPNLKALSKGQEPPDVENEAQKKWMMETPYPLVRDAMREQMPEYQKLKEQIVSASNQLLQAHNDYIESKTTISKAQQAMYRGKNEVCTAAKLKLDQSMEVVRKAYQLPEMKAYDAKIEKAGKQIDARIDELAAQNPQILELEEKLLSIRKIRQQAIQDIQRKNQFEKP